MTVPFAGAPFGARPKLSASPSTSVAASWPVTVLFDDYAARPAYHVVEQMIRPIALHGRMAQFQIDPTPMPASPERWITASFQRPL